MIEFITSLFYMFAIGTGVAALAYVITKAVLKKLFDKD